ncbi:hypothetical protein [Nostoc sp. ATCC 53789]|jgi:hypothetical protein|uniref:hypothetical protein n=1 Tax=Nostoc sp. ATCC 53789 TaxID=76335 RepID=UPI000DED35D4|nr:hypothetical protein [Nostoc sp. ATCC 53789]MBD2513061.1 hypothetical protein [Desmonostoc muscorum FACHB-395]QHG14730.1 hypothetical protein GJB62_01120 [Nostoc sp. ATCC 53789]RCJ35794.1 hypothetical protein A6V25_00280 [Nostoc sp. ATCC 53789]
MVERPIKKSERQSQANTDSNSENKDSITPIESNPKSSKPSRNRSSDKGKKASYGDENRQQGNPALARGPKPVKPPVAKVQTEELETESETIPEESQD